MVGMMSSNSCSPERLLALVTSAISATTIPSKLDSLRQLSEIIRQENDADSLSQLLPLLFDLQSDQHSPVRKLATEIIGDIGVKHVEFVPEIVYLLINVLEDRVPAVARQAIACGLNIFRSTLEKIAIQGLCTSELDDQLKASWESVLVLKESIYAIAFQPGSGGVRLLALKFVEAVIILYTPDPNGSPEPPSHEGTGVEFNVSWIRGGHPVLNIGDLSIEASKRLALLLDQLRFPTVKSVSYLVIIVVINSLATVVKKRPPFYGRILPVLLGLDPSNSGIEGMHGYGACHALKKAFLICLKCTHQGAAPWRDRLVCALREMKVEGLEEEAMLQNFKSNGGAEESKEDLQGAKEEKLVIKPNDDLTGKLRKKRVVSEVTSEVAEDNNVSEKRAKTTPSVSEESNKEFNRNITVGTDEITSDATTSNRIDEDNGPVQQLVAMFGALVAQGERAVGSLEILISSISADLLADVVMANMRYLPSGHPEAKGDDELLVNMPIVGSHSQAKYPPSFLANVLSLSTTFPPVALQLNAHRSVTNDVVAPEGEEEALHNTIVSDSVEEYAGISHKEEDDEMMPAGLPTSPNAISPGMEGDGLAIPSDVHDISNLESGIPGLDSSARIDGFSETLGTSSVVSTDVEDASQEVVTSLAERSNIELLPSVSTDRSERSEELSSKATATDTTSMISSTATSLGWSCPVVLPKMSAPVVILADEQKDQLQTTAFLRVIEAYKQIAVAGGSQVRFSLLASLGLEFPSDLDPWKVLQNHVLDDYVNHEGHELTLRVLYRLFSEVEEERDLFSSTTAASAYESFLLIVAKTLRDSFPPSDKSLSRLLGEAPSLPKSVLNLLEALCCPDSCDKSEKESQSGDRVTQGLSTVWSLILLRPPIREDCLRIALQSAVHHLEEVRMKAIRLVANRLYPLSSISQQIESFATQKMLSIVKGDATVSIDAEEAITEPKDSNLQKPEKLPVSVTKDLPSDTHPSRTLLSVPENQQCMSLYFALCTKKHSLFREIFVVYKSASKDVKQAVQHHIPILVRTMGSSSELLQIISDPPNGSEELLIQILQTLTDGTVPSPELLFTIRKLYDSKLKNAEILIPILPFLPREEVLLTFPHLVNLPMDKFQAALARVLQGSPHSGQVLTPAEVLIAIHGIDPDRDGIPLKKVTDACNACFEQRQTFTQQVLAKVLNQLVEQIPLPLLFMRTVLQAIGAFPALVEFIMDILSRLVSKQIWKYPKLWVGFLKCAQLTQPKSFSVLLQLPPLQLENALNRTAALKAPLVAHASQPNIKSSLPRSTLVVLGVITEPPQPSSQSQTSQVQTVDASNSEKEVITEKYASNSEKEVIKEKSKDSSDAS